MTPQREEALCLLRLAKRDRETFDLLLPLPKASLAALGFHAQQAAEKALKAVAVSLGLEVPRTTLPPWANSFSTAERHCP